jgi:hypothetical protein
VEWKGSSSYSGEVIVSTGFSMVDCCGFERLRKVAFEWKCGSSAGLKIILIMQAFKFCYVRRPWDSLRSCYVVGV